MKIPVFTSPQQVHRRVIDNPINLFHGDCSELIKEVPENSIDLVITSPPYCMGKSYETTNSIDRFIENHENILSDIIRITKHGGSICWQIGYHVKNKNYIPLDFLIYDIMKNYSEIRLRNRIIWTFGHGAHARTRLSGRHELMLWFTKGNEYYFDLDAIRIPQKYPGKRHYKGPNKGKFSGNPKGKNPGDVWHIPNVKAGHVEKTDHPCQFPVALAQRAIQAFSPPKGLIFDPFMGSGSAGVASVQGNRRFLGAELLENYIKISSQRIQSALKGDAKIRPLLKPIHQPEPSSAVASIPSHFEIGSDNERHEG